MKIHLSVEGKKSRGGTLKTLEMVALTTAVAAKFIFT